MQHSSYVVSIQIIVANRIIFELVHYCLGRERLTKIGVYHFPDCNQNRIRLTADGRIKPCLHSGDEYSLKGRDFDGMVAELRNAILHKPSWHGALDAVNRSRAGRNMNQIGG